MAAIHRDECSAVFHRNVSSVTVVRVSVRQHISLLTLGAKPARGTGALASSRITGGTIVALTLLFTLGTIPSSTTLPGTERPHEARGTQALSGVPTTLVGPTLALLFTPRSKCSFWADKVTCGTCEAWSTVTLARAGVTRSTMLALADTGTVHAVKARWTHQLTVAAIAPRTTLAAPRESVTGGVGMTGTVEAAVRAISSWFTLQVAVLACPSQPTLTFARCWVTDGIILALTFECTGKAPSVVWTGMLTARAHVSCRTPAFPSLATYTSVLTLTPLMAVSVVVMGEAGEVTSGAVETRGTSALTSHWIACTSIATLTLLLAAHSITALRTQSSTVSSTASSRAVAGAIDGVAEGRLWALALLQALLSPPPFLTVLLALLPSAPWRTHARAGHMVTRLAWPTPAPFPALLPVETSRTHCLAPVTREASRTLTLTSDVMTGGTVVTVAHTSTLISPRPLVTGLVAVLSTPAGGTHAGTRDGVAAPAVLTLALT